MALRYSLGYALVSFIWFAACDQLLGHLGMTTEDAFWLAFLLDTLFVSVTAALFYLQVDRSFTRDAVRYSRAAEIEEITARPSLLVIALLLVSIGVIGLTLYHAVKKQLAASAIDNLASISRLKANQISAWLEEAHIESDILLNSNSFKAELRTWIDNGKRDDKFATYLLTRLKETRNAGRFNTVSLYDAKGALLMSSTPSVRSDRYGAILAAAVQQGEAGADKLYSSDATASDDGDIGYFSPLRDTETSRPIAILHIALSPERKLYPLLNQWPGSSASAETLLLRRDGETVVSLNPLRHGESPPLQLSLPLDSSGRLETRALDGHTGPLKGVDYRMQQCLAYSIPIAGTSWAILDKIDEAEVDSTLNSLAKLASATVIAQLLAASWWLSRYYRALELRNRAQAEHLKVSSRMETLVKHANDCIIMLDENHRIIDVNDRALSTYGYTSEEMLALSGADLFARPEEEQVHALRLRQAFEGQLLYVSEHRRKDGSTFPVETSLVAMDVGGARRTQKIIRDISERVSNEQKLLQSNQTIRKAAEEIEDLYQNAPCGYHSLDANGVFVRINQTELNWLGYTREELIGKIRLQDLLDPDHVERFCRDYLSLIKQGEINNFDLELVCKDGRRLPVLVTATAVRDKDGSILTIRSTLHNMTERIKMENERLEFSMRLDNLSRRLVSSQEASKRQLSAVLHDQTSPNLAAIEINLNVISRLLASHQSPEVSAILDDIAALLNDTTMSIREICSELRPSLLDYAGLMPALEGYASQFSRRTGMPVRIGCNDPSARLDPDTQSLLFRIAQEAMTNCAKHAQATLIEVELNHADGETVLTVADNGKGFNAELLGKNGADVGMGILNMREISEFIGGRLHIETAPGQGTIIRVEFARSNIAMDQGELA